MNKNTCINSLSVEEYIWPWVYETHSLMEEAASQSCCMGFEATEPSDLGEEVREG